MHNAHVQAIDHTHFRHLTMDDNDVKVKNNGSHQKSLKIIATSSDILCIFAFSGQRVGH